MKNNVWWIFELSVKDGKFEELNKLMSEMVEATERNEKGTLAYEWTISMDGGKCHIYERYVDSEAAITHLTTFLNQYATRLMETGDATGFVVYGNPNDGLKNILDGFNPDYMEHLGGFNRKAKS